MTLLARQLAHWRSRRETRANLARLLRYLGFLVLLVSTYAVLFHVIMLYVEGERHSWITGFYWTLVVMTTLGFGFLDRPGVREQLRLAAKAEALGYDSLWVTETRLARDAVSVLGAMAATTERVRLGSCIVNSWTRGPALMAMTFALINNQR